MNRPKRSGQTLPATIKEIARRHVGQEPVPIAERNDSHAVISTPVSHRLVTAASPFYRLGPLLTC
jgi:hypothetical protein